jgi:ketosteroid isomerase-like protein
MENLNTRIPELSLILVLIVVAPAHGDTPTLKRADQMAEEQLVLAAEDAYVAAEINRDEAELRRLLDDRFLLNSADGTTSGKEELIGAILRWNMTGQTISERSVMIEGDIAIIFGTAELRFGTGGPDQRVSEQRYTSVYVRRKGQWRMIALQMTPRSPRA